MSDYSTLLTRVRDAGLLRRRYLSYSLKLAALGLGLVAVCVAAVLVGESWWQLAVASGAAIVVVQVIFLSHDAAHRQIFHTARANEWTALLLGTGVGGISLGWWNTKHTRHHGAPNQIGKDPDIDSKLVRFYAAEPTAVEPSQARRAGGLARRQGWWFFPLLIAEGLHLHVKSILTVATRRGMKHRILEAILLTLRLGGYPALLFILLPWQIAVAFLGTQLAVTGLYLGAAFAASHVGMPIVAKDAKIDFLRRQVLTSRNVAGGMIASAAMGGLNYQIEHHLFPSMPGPSLRRARPIVRAFCRQHAIDYTEVPIHGAWAAVTRHLNAVGIARGLTVSCPTAATLR